MGRFWFIGRESREGQPEPSILVGYAEPAPTTPPGTEGGNIPVDERRYSGPSLYADEVWPSVSTHYPQVGCLNQSYYPSGSVCWCPENGSALLLIDAKLNQPAFLETIARWFNVPLATADVKVMTHSSARAEVGPPDPEAPLEPDLYGRPINPVSTSALAQSHDQASADQRVDEKQIKDRALGAMLGLAVGDALGSTLEFSARDTQPVVRDLVGGGPFRLQPGEWTDDTSMALCLADSLIAHSGLDTDDLIARFLRWYRQGENSVTGRCFDIGRTTRAALERYERTGRTAADGPHDSKQAGNGTLMRLAPVALFAASNAAMAGYLAERQSRTTHPAHIAHEACRFLATLLVEAINGASREEVLASRYWMGGLAPIAAGEWKAKRRDEIVSSGYALATLEAALWCVERTTSFEGALVLAVNLADDADTVGAVTGQLAGALYGRDGIPSRWLDRLAWREQIEAKAFTLFEKSRERCPS